MQGFCLYIHIMQKAVKIIGVVLILFVFSVAYLLFGSGTSFEDKSKDIYIPSGTTSVDSVTSILERSDAFSNLGVLKTLISFF